MKFGRWLGFSVFIIALNLSLSSVVVWANDGENTVQCADLLRLSEIRMKFQSVPELSPMVRTGQSNAEVYKALLKDRRLRFAYEQQHPGDLAEIPRKLVYAQYGMKFHIVPKGKFTRQENGPRGNDAGQEIIVPEDFELMSYLVTEENYERVMEKKPRVSRGPKYPVVEISWYEGAEFANRVSEGVGLQKRYEFIRDQAGNIIDVKINKDANGYGHPTLDQLQYVKYFNGPRELYFWPDPVDDWSNESPAVQALRDYEWFSNNSGGELHPVGELKPLVIAVEEGQATGVFKGFSDMSGNARAWCEDEHKNEYGSNRVLGGASWYSGAQLVRSARWHSHLPAARHGRWGLRLSRPLRK